jgi:hypothetical protein
VKRAFDEELRKDGYNVGINGEGGCHRRELLARLRREGKATRDVATGDRDTGLQMALRTRAPIRDGRSRTFVRRRNW